MLFDEYKVSYAYILDVKKRREQIKYCQARPLTYRIYFDTATAVIGFHVTVASEDRLSRFDLILVNRTITDKEPFINERVLSALVRGRQLQETTQCPRTNP